MLNIETDAQIKPVTGREGLFYIRADMNTAISKFNKEGMQIISERDLAKFRILGGYNHPFSTATCTTRGQMIYYGSKSLIKRFIFSRMPVLISLDGIEKNEDGVIDYDFFREKAEEDAKKNPLERKVLIVPSDTDFVIPYDEVANILPAKVRRTVPIPVEEYLKMDPKDKFCMKHFDQPDNESLSLNIQRIHHPQEHYLRIVELSKEYIVDNEWMAKQTEMANFAVGLFKEYALAYAFLNETPFSTDNSRILRINMPFGLNMPEKMPREVETDEIRISGVENDSEINPGSDWGSLLMGEGPIFGVKKNLLEYSKEDNYKHLLNSVERKFS
jgi:hypothetical protein